MIPTVMRWHCPVGYTSFQSRNRETYDSNDISWTHDHEVSRMFQSRNRETYDSNCINSCASVWV